MALQFEIHHAQTEILRTLLFTEHATFSELCKRTGFSSDHFNFHIKKLLEANLVEKTKDKTYRLTHGGKEYANQLDTDDRTIEKQPKTGVLLIVERKRDDGQNEYIFQERLKQPFYGFFLFPTGKVRWGETFEYTAERELKEETNLEGTFKLIGITRKRDYSKEDNKLLEDKVFYNMLCSDAHGELMTEFEGGRNYWLTHDEFIAKGKSILDARIEFKHLNLPELTYYQEEYFHSKQDY